MNSPYRAHPALPFHGHDPTAPAGNTIPFPAGASTSAPPRPAPPQPNRLAQLITLEGDIRELPTPVAVSFHAVNEARALAGFAMGFHLRLNRRGTLSVEAVSNVTSADLHAPLVLAVSSLATRTLRQGKAGPLHVSLAGLQGGAFPFPHGLLLPLLDRKKKPFAALLYARATVWEEADIQIATRIAGAYRHALLALTPPPLLRLPSFPKWSLAAALVVAAALALIPVPLTALAPFEVVAQDPMIVAAPIDGVISEIAADANSAVKAGQVLFRFDATLQTADLAIAVQKVELAESKLSAARNGAFSDGEAKRSLAVSEKELQLAEAERDLSQSLLERTTVTAAQDGLLIYTSRSELMGKPVRTGEKVMEIADPAHVAFRIDLGVKDSIVLAPGAAVRLFLDADPLHPLSAEVREIAYHAQEVPGGTLAYDLRAQARSGEAPRIGLRGTAQVTGEKVALGFYLLRRPLAALRQYFGR